MILNHYYFESPIDFRNRVLQLLIVENHRLLGELIAELIRQTKGMAGRFILLQRDKELDIQGAVRVSLDLFDVEVFMKEVVNGFIQRLAKEMVSEDRYEDTDRMLKSMHLQMLKAASDMEPESDLSEPQLVSLLKLTSPRFPERDYIQERVCDMVTLGSKYTKTKLFVFVNTHEFMSDGEYEELLGQLAYLQVPTLMVESRHFESSFPMKIIDADQCEFDVSGHDNIFEV